MRIINIIKDVKPIRMGVWMAATNTAPVLHQKFNIESEIWYPGKSYDNPFHLITPVSLKSRKISYLKHLIKERNLKPDNDVIVTHSAWGFQSAWGSYLSRQGFNWIFMPHGSFEPWAFSHKWLKKKIYFETVESVRLRNAQVIRASSTPERENLLKRFPEKKIVIIPNGCIVNKENAYKQNAENKKYFLFMARLHDKKGVLPLVKAWLNSSLRNNTQYELIIAGPDEGELKKIKPLLDQSNNVTYVGAVYDEAKDEWLKKSSFYILPSKAEGFPMSVLEAATKGAIPVISDGCNFPEIFQKNLAIKTGPSENEVLKSLVECSNMSDDKIEAMSKNVKTFVDDNYSIDVVAGELNKMYKSLLKK